jgi:hypothetical protein
MSPTRTKALSSQPSAVMPALISCQCAGSQTLIGLATPVADEGDLLDEGNRQRSPLWPWAVVGHIAQGLTQHAAYVLRIERDGTGQPLAQARRQCRLACPEGAIDPHDPTTPVAALDQLLSRTGRGRLG